MLRLEIITPERRVLDADVESVTLPTASGEAGILPSHAPLISAIKPGILAYSNKGAVEKIAVSGGFVEVNSDTVAVLVDTAETAGEIDINAARADRENSERAALGAGLVSEDEAANTRDLLDHALARLQLAGGR